MFPPPQGPPPRPMTSSGPPPGAPPPSGAAGTDTGPPPQQQQQHSAFPPPSKTSLQPPMMVTPQSTPSRQCQLQRPTVRSLPRPPKRSMMAGTATGTATSTTTRHVRRGSGSGFKLPPTSTTPIRSHLPPSLLQQQQQQSSHSQSQSHYSPLVVPASSPLSTERPVITSAFPTTTTSAATATSRNNSHTGSPRVAAADSSPRLSPHVTMSPTVRNSHNNLRLPSPSRTASPRYYNTNSHRLLHVSPAASSLSAEPTTHTTLRVSSSAAAAAQSSLSSQAQAQPPPLVPDIGLPTTTTTTSTTTTADTTRTTTTTIPPHPWKELCDETSGRVYYLNEETNATSWTLPPLMSSSPLPQEQSSVAASITESARPAAVVAITQAPPSPMEEERPARPVDNDDDDDVASATEPPLAELPPPATEADYSTKPQQLQSGWVEANDPNTGAIYYYHAESGVTQWEAPLLGILAAAADDDDDAKVDPSSEEAVADTVVVEPTTRANDDDDAHTAAASEPQEIAETAQEEDEPNEIVGEQVAPVPPSAAETKESNTIIALQHALPPNWVQLEHEGRPYFYNELSQETSWERPQAAPAATMSVASSDNDFVVVEDDDNLLLLSDAAGDDDSPALDDSSSPNCSTAHDNDKEPKVVEDAPMSGSVVMVDAASVDEDDNNNNVDEMLAASALPVPADGWVEQYDETSGQTFYMHSESGVTQWERPLAATDDDDKADNNINNNEPSQLQPPQQEEEVVEAGNTMGDGAAVPDDSADANVVDDDDDNNSAAPESTEPVLKEGWVAAVDESSGQTYYFHAESGESSWEPPVVAATATAADDDDDVATQETENPEETIAAEEAAAAAVIAPGTIVEADDENDDEPNTTGGEPLPPGWSELVDEGSGQVYYFNSIDNSTSWERPNATTDVSNAELPQQQHQAPEDDHHGQPELVDNPENTGSEGDEAMAAVNALAVEDEGQPAEEPGIEASPENQVEGASTSAVEGWVEMVDEDSGQAYYYNEVSGETSWERPGSINDATGSPEITSRKSSQTVGEDATTAASPTPEDDGLDTSESKPPAPSSNTTDLPEPWVEVLDESSGEKYFYNEETGESSWEYPGETPDSDEQVHADSGLPAGWVVMLDEDSGEEYYFNEETNESSWEHPSQQSSIKENDLESELPPGWEAAVDESSGNVFYLNTVDGTTTWDKPVVEKQAPPRPAHAAAAFGFGGKLCVQKAGSNGQVSVHSVNAIVPTDTILHVEDVKKKAGVAGPLYLSSEANFVEYLKVLEKEENDGLLWKLIHIAYQHNGKLKSGDPHGPPEKAIVDLLLDHQVELDVDRSPKDSGLVDSTHLKRAQELLLRGDREAAVSEALLGRHFDIALMTASMCGQKLFKQVATECAEKSLSKGTPIYTASMLFSGNAAAMVDTSCVNASSAMWECDDETLRWSWKGHLATIISNRVSPFDEIVVSLGDRLLELDEIDAAHFCYLVAGSPIASATRNARLTLLGCNVKPDDLTLLTEESILGFECTEAMEWIRRINNPDAKIESLQVFKLLYSMQLTDLGLTESARMYAEDVVACLRDHASELSDETKDTAALPLSVSSSPSTLIAKAKALLQRLNSDVVDPPQIDHGHQNEPPSDFNATESQANEDDEVTPGSLVTSKAETSERLQPTSESEGATSANDTIPKLPTGWVETAVQDTGQIYYYNQETGETSWEVPVDSESKAALSTTVSIPNGEELLPGWIEVAGENGNPSYYYHEQDGTTSWERPIANPDAIAPEGNDVHEGGLIPDEQTCGESLPAGWTEIRDPDTDAVYYYNESTNETTWETPSESQDSIGESKAVPSVTSEVNDQLSNVDALYEEPPPTSEAVAYKSDSEPPKLPAMAATGPPTLKMSSAEETQPAPIVTEPSAPKETIGLSALDTDLSHVKKKPPMSTPQRTVPSSTQVTPAAKAKTPTAPSSAPANLEAAKQKRGSWFKSTFTKFLNPNATVADTGDEMQAYYDKDLKVWVFPGEDPAEKAAPIAPPPIIPRKTETPAEPVEDKKSSPADPLSAMMVPPNRRGIPKKKAPVGSAALSQAPKSAPPPQFAVFQPKP